MINKNIRPNKGNINLMISVDEIENIIDKIGDLPRTGYLVKIDDYSYRLPALKGDEKLDSKICELTKNKLINLLNTSSGLYNIIKKKIASRYTEFRIELKLEEEKWVMC